MLLSRRGFFAVMAAGALSACGFTPVYAPGGSAEGLRGRITMAAPDDRESYELVKQLEHRLGRNTAAPYVLSYDITTRSEGMGVTSEQEITRTQVLGAIEYQVSHAGSGEVVHRGAVSNFASYSNEGSTVSTASVERDAHRRLMVILADMITARVLASYASWAP